MGFSLKDGIRGSVVLCLVHSPFAPEQAATHLPTKQFLVLLYVRYPALTPAYILAQNTIFLTEERLYG